MILEVQWQACITIYQLFEIPRESPGLGGSIGGGGETIPETGEKHLITLSAHNSFFF